MSLFGDQSCFSSKIIVPRTENVTRAGAGVATILRGPEDKREGRGWLCVSQDRP